jgi:hypothetical protein
MSSQSEATPAVEEAVMHGAMLQSWSTPTAEMFSIEITSAQPRGNTEDFGDACAS